MADNTAQQPEDVPFDKDFNAEDADIVVQSTATSKIKALRFKVHRKNLASASSVLAGMLEVPLTESANTPAPPVVQLSEDSDVIRVILAMACNNADGLQFKGDTDWRFIWRVWEAACKYEMFGLRAYAQMALFAQSDKINSSDAFEIYGRAALLGDQILCDHFIGKAAKKSLAAGDTRVASQIPTASLINYSICRDRSINMSLEACRNTLYDLATPEKVHFYRNPETLTVSRRDLLELHDALGRISTEHMM